MCYKKPGPRCSRHAEQKLIRAQNAHKYARSDNSRIDTMNAVKEAELEYDMTPGGQRKLRDLIEAGQDTDGLYQMRLEHGIKARQESLNAIKSLDRGDVEDAHVKVHDDGAPKLSIPLPEPFGRVYRMPGSAPLRTGPNGGVILPSEDEYHAKIVSGEWVPSITNVLGVRNAEHLIPWSAGRAAKAMLELIDKAPERVRKNPAGALSFARLAAERERDAAAEQGTRVHYACEQIALGKEVEPKYLSPREWKYVDNFRRWTDDFQPEFIANEVTVFGTTPSGPYAGTADFIARINGITVAGDYKTTRSGLHNDVAFQLAAVAHADTFTTDGVNLKPMIPIDAGYGVHLSPESYEMRPAIIDGQSWEIFKSLRATWNVHAFDGLQDDGRTTLGAPATSLADIKRLRD